LLMGIVVLQFVIIYRDNTVTLVYKNFAYVRIYKAYDTVYLCDKMLVIALLKYVICVLLYMIKKEKYHFEPNQVKFDIIDFLLKNNDSVSEPEIHEHLNDKYSGISGINQSNVNRPLHWLHGKGCLELEKRRSNIWSVKTLKNLENILVQYPDFVGILQNSEHALNIVLDALEDALVSSTNLKKTKEYKEKYDVIKERLSNIRKDLTEKLKMSSAFFKLCVQDEYLLWRNLIDILEISDYPAATPYIGDGFTLFINSPSCIDLAFKSCIALEIMERKGNIIKDMKKEIDFVKQMNNTVFEGQLNQLEKYYEKTQVAPAFLKDKKFISVRNDELDKLQAKFEKKGGKWDDFKNEEPEGPA
jgi:hypothetical protein